jgi:hypothetical protein
MFRIRRLVALAGLALVGSAAWGGGSASAALIKPNAGRAYPDIAADINGKVNYAYDSSTETGVFHVTNTPYLIAGGASSSAEYAVTTDGDGVRQQVINIALDKGGNLVASDANSYSLYGTIQADGQTFSGLLLQGKPTAFGFQDLDGVGIQGSDVFDLNLDITGGALASYFGSEAYIRVTPELQSTFRGRFDEDFSAVKATSNTRSYVAPQPFPIPEPSTWLVFGAVGLGLYRYRRRAPR